MVPPVSCRRYRGQTGSVPLRVPLPGEVLPHVRTIKVDVARARGDPVQYRVGHQLALDPQVPLVGLELRGDEGCRAPLAGLLCRWVDASNAEMTDLDLRRKVSCEKNHEEIRKLLSKGRDDGFEQLTRRCGGSCRE